MSGRELKDLGWSDSLHDEFVQGRLTGEVPARVVAPDRGYVDVLSETGPARAMLTGPARFDPPSVGDWVYLLSGDPPTVRDRLHRKSELCRKSAGSTSRKQCIAANVDIAFIVTDHEHDLNLRRLERYLTAVQDGGSRPAIVLNKADEVAAPEKKKCEVEAAFENIVVVSLSAIEPAAADVLLRKIHGGETAVLVGSSGVGKSTIINALTGAEQSTGTIDSVGKGRHTTTSRQMFALPGGGWLIDTPGMREFALVDVDSASIEQTFSDVRELAANCRFGDCRHDREPGCAVREALTSGQLDEDRFRGYEKLQREAVYENSRADEAGWREQKRTAKEFAKKYRKPNQTKAKRRGDT